MSTALNQASLASLSGDIAIPDYDRSRLSQGILHVGVGNFHRAHMGVYLDRLFSRGGELDWAIVGAGVRPSDAQMRQKLQTQDWLTTVVELDPSGPSSRVIGSMMDFLPVVPEAILAGMADPRIRIVSLTVTEGGYFIDASTGALDTVHPDIVADAAAPDTPRTAFGLMIKALQARRAAGIAPFAVLSCDNLPGNGSIARQTTAGLARLFDSSFADWIEAEVAFPNSVVDCITPATGERERSLVRDRFGILDAVPVVCEPYRQWVIEDNFPQDRPSLEQVGVEFVSDVSRHELMKLRILNAGHASIAYAAALLGYHFVHDAMADADIRNWLKALQLREVIPMLAPIEGLNYRDYLDSVIARFCNPEIGDTIPRLAADGSDRQPKFVLPTLRDALATSGPVRGHALEVAIWCRYCLAKDEGGRAVRIQDPLSSELNERAVRARHQPKAFLENTSVFGDLSRNCRFVAAFSEALERLHAVGVRGALVEYETRRIRETLIVDRTG